MKDLYARNRLDPREPDQGRVLNCEGGHEEDREAAFAILLNEKKKQVYDQAHSALEAIGYIRANCDLNNVDWGRKNSDFYQTASVEVPVVDLDIDHLPPVAPTRRMTAVPDEDEASITNKKSNRAFFVRHSLLLLLLLAVAGAAFYVWWSRFA